MIPRVIVVGAVAIVLAIVLVVLETIMRGDKIYTRPGTATPLVEDIARAGNPARHFRHLAVVALPESAHIVAKLVIPFGPAGRKARHLVAARTHIPGLRDELHTRKNRILTAGIEKSATLIETIRL